MQQWGSVQAPAVASKAHFQTRSARLKSCRAAERLVRPADARVPEDLSVALERPPGPFVLRLQAPLNAAIPATFAKQANADVDGGRTPVGDCRGNRIFPSRARAA